MNDLYQDGLVAITDDSIILKKYYFPVMTPKVIVFGSIKYIEVLEPTLINGKWRIIGSGDFRTWLPWDSARPARDKIFRITYRNKWVRTGFTVEDSKTVEEILNALGLLK